MTRLLLLLELALVLLALCAVLASAGRLALSRRRRGPALTAASRALADALDATDWQGAPPAFRELRRPEHVAVLGALASSLTGMRRTRLRAVAEDVGLLTHAKHRCHSLLWWRRLEGARLLTLLGGGDRVMQRLLDDRRDEVRAQAMEWAGDHPRADAVDRLVDRLGDPATLCRFTVKESLLRLREAAVPALRTRLDAQTGPLADLLQVATWSADPSYLDAAVSLAVHPEPATRAAAVRLLGALGGARGIEPVTAALNDPAEQVRAAAAEAVGRLGHWPSAAGLGARLRDPAWEVRREAGLALSRLGAPGQLVLRRALADDDAFAADMAQLVLGVHGPARPA